VEPSQVPKIDHPLGAEATDESTIHERAEAPAQEAACRTDGIFVKSEYSIFNHR